MFPVEVTESVAVVTVPNYAEQSVETVLDYKDGRRHKSVVYFEPSLAPVRFANTLIVFGHDSTRKRYVSRTFFQPRLRPCKFHETSFVFPKTKTARFASFLDYHMDERRKWFKTCMELKARVVTSVLAVSPGASSSSVTSVGGRFDVMKLKDDGPGASQMFIPPFTFDGDVGHLGERQFRVGLSKTKVDCNMNARVLNGF